MRFVKIAFLSFLLVFPFEALSKGFCSHLYEKIALIFKRNAQKTKVLDDIYQAKLLEDAPHLQQIRASLNRLPPEAQEEKWLSEQVIDGSFKKDLEIFDSYIAQEKKLLKELQNLGPSPIQSREDLQKHPRLKVFEISLDRLKKYRERQREYHRWKTDEEWQSETAEVLENSLKEVNEWISKTPEMVASLEKLSKDVKKLERKNKVSLREYLQAVSDFLNIFSLEPAFNYDMGNSAWPKKFTPSHFLTNPFAEHFGRKVFPFRIYFPAFQGMSLEKLNDLFAVGISPMEIIPGGKIVTADGGEWTSPLSFAGHDNGHSPGGDSTNDFLENSYLRFKFKEALKLLDPGKRKKLEYLYFYLGHERQINLYKYSERCRDSKIRKEQISVLASGIKAEPNQGLILKENAFRDSEDIAQEAEFFLKFLYDLRSRN